MASSHEYSDFILLFLFGAFSGPPARASYIHIHYSGSMLIDMGISLLLGFHGPWIEVSNQTCVVFGHCDVLAQFC